VSPRDLARSPGTAFLVICVSAMTFACDSGEPAASPGSPPSQRPAETPRPATPTADASEPGPETPDTNVTPAPEPSESLPNQCPKEWGILADGNLAQPRSLTGEVDGDGVTDEIRLVVDRKAKPGCQAWVVVATDGGDIAAPIEEEDLPFDLGLPALERLVPVDNRAGDEVLIRIHSGASTQFFGLFTAVDGELRRVLIIRKDEGPPVALSLPSGGSVGHFDAADCARDRVVISSAVLKGDRYKVKRSFYSPGPVLRGRSTEQKLVAAKGMNDFPEFAATPLGSCVLP
jgi:hypothetical protein